MGIPGDGIIAPDTRGAWYDLSEAKQRFLAGKVWAERIAYLGRIVTADPTQAVFAAGWMKRVADQVKACA
mgnify:CR=1 FL=1